MFTPTTPENASIILKLEGVLASLPIGSLADYLTLNLTAGCDVRVKHRWLLRKAVDNIEKTLGCAFECVRGMGIRRLTSDEAPDIGLSSIRKVRATAKRGKRRIERMNQNSLSDYDRRRIVGYGAMLGAIALIADGRRAISIAAVADPAKPIPPKNILSMFARD